MPLHITVKDLHENMNYIVAFDDREKEFYTYCADKTPKDEINSSWHHTCIENFLNKSNKINFIEETQNMFSPQPVSVEDRLKTIQKLHHSGKDDIDNLYAFCDVIRRDKTQLDFLTATKHLTDKNLFDYTIKQFKKTDIEKPFMHGMFDDKRLIATHYDAMPIPSYYKILQEQMKEYARELRSEYAQSNHVGSFCSLLGIDIEEVTDLDKISDIKKVVNHRTQPKMQLSQQFSIEI